VGSKRGLGEGADRGLDSESADPVKHEAATTCTERDPRYVGSSMFGLQEIDRWLCMSYNSVIWPSGSWHKARAIRKLVQ